MLDVRLVSFRLTRAGPFEEIKKLEYNTPGHFEFTYG
jgi:hypothetical protein